MDTINGETDNPCLVETRQGFSVLYRNHYLYSKYNPSQSIKKIIEQTQFKPNTLILIFSPVLFYGFSELLKKISDNSFILAIETDITLFKFSQKYYEEKNIKDKSLFLNIKTNFEFSKLFESNSLPPLGLFRHVITLDFSSGVQFNRIQYDSFKQLADNFVSTFWKNRITLTKMGRLYAKNIFTNLKYISSSENLIPKSVNRPIIVLGAGLSVEKVLPVLSKEADRFFIIAVDAVTKTLLKSGIIPDKIVMVESQLANEKSFIGVAGSKLSVITDLTSRPNLGNLTQGKKSFFLSEYTKCNFIERLKNTGFISLFIPPLGSVGLVAIEIALFLRTQNIPVYFAGLDFCYDCGKTHCKEAPVHRTNLDTHYRLNPIEKVLSAFKNHASYHLGKDNKYHITDPALSTYAQLFSARYSMIENLWDIGNTGINLGSRFSTIEQMIENVKKYPIEKKYKETYMTEKTNQINSKDFLSHELNCLLKIKNILTGKITDSKNELQSLLSQREYLYLHFPDAYLGLQMNESFLKRIRAELDIFIKTIQLSLNY